jgi:hypothetical protein
VKSCPNRAHIREKADTIDIIDEQPPLILRKLLNHQVLSDNPAYRLTRLFSTTYGQVFKNLPENLPVAFRFKFLSR